MYGVPVVLSYLFETSCVVRVPSFLVSNPTKTDKQGGIEFYNVRGPPCPCSEPDNVRRGDIESYKVKVVEDVNKTLDLRSTSFSSLTQPVSIDLW